MVYSNSALDMFGGLVALILKRFRGCMLRIEDFEGGILVAHDSLCLSVFLP